jgi:peptide/nickel transport system substrate-binding protein
MRKICAVAIAAVFVASMISVHTQDEVLLKIGCLGGPATLNIWNSDDIWSIHICGWFYPSFYYRKPVTLEPLPDMCTIPYDTLRASSWDGLTYRFPLRNDVYWDDGLPLTAHDFEFTYNLIKELEFPNYVPIYKDVEYMQARDDYTIELRLKKCTPWLEESLIYHSAVPKHQFEPMLREVRNTDNPVQSFRNMIVDNPISAGPFSFDWWDDDVKLVTNRTYYGKGRVVTVEDAGEMVEGPWYDGVLFKQYSTSDAAILGIKKGEIDYVWWNLDPEYILDFSGDPTATLEKADEFVFYYLAPNIARKPFDDKQLRQALTYLVDKEFIVSRLLQEYGDAAHSVVIPAAGEWYNNDVNTFGSGMLRSERLATATEILDAAGYTVPQGRYPENVIRLPNGDPMQPFEILTPDYDPLRITCCALIQEWWREIGVPVTARSISFDEIMHDVFETREFDWYIMGWNVGGFGYPGYLRNFFHSDQAIPFKYNPMSYKNPEVDRALEDLVSLCDHADLLEAAWLAQELIIDDVAYCPLYYRTLIEVRRNDTFEGWFTQVEGIVSSESPTSCLLYLWQFGAPKPKEQGVTEQEEPEKTPEKPPEEPSEEPPEETLKEPEEISEEERREKPPEDGIDHEILLLVLIILAATTAVTAIKKMGSGPKRGKGPEKKKKITIHKPPRRWLTEKRIAGFWVYPYLETIRDSHHVTIVIVKGLETKWEPLLGETVNARLFDEEDNALPLVERPEAGPLLEVGGQSISANAGFKFTVSALSLKSLAVTIGDDTEIFNVTDTTEAKYREEVSKKITEWKCCVKTFNVPVTRSGRKLSGSRLYESFHMNVTFNDRSKCRSSSCEFRQYIRGTYTHDGILAIHQLPDGPLDPLIWQEDGIPHHFPDGHHMFYGHRDNPDTRTDTYEPDRATGHEYRGSDSPMMSHPDPAVVMVMNLEFRGKIIDVSSGKVVRTTTWKVNHSKP